MCVHNLALPLLVLACSVKKRFTRNSPPSPSCEKNYPARFEIVEWTNDDKMISPTEKVLKKSWFLLSFISTTPIYTFGGKCDTWANLGSNDQENIFSAHFRVSVIFVHKNSMLFAHAHTHTHIHTHTQKRDAERQKEKRDNNFSERALCVGVRLCVRMCAFVTMRGLVRHLIATKVSNIARYKLNHFATTFRLFCMKFACGKSR